MPRIRKSKWFYDELLKVNFWFCVGWTRKQFTDFMEFQAGHTPPDLISSHGRCIDLTHRTKKGSRTYVIWTAKEAPRSALVHECVHATNMALSSAGHRIDADNDEIQAYYVERLFRFAGGDK